MAYVFLILSCEYTIDSYLEETLCYHLTAPFFSLLHHIEQ